MPVDYMGVVLGAAVWIGGTVAVYRMIRKKSGRHAAGTWTIFAALPLAAVGFAVAWLYEWLHGRA